MRLNKYIAKSGIASRRKADILIEEGLIKINGEVVTNFGFQINDDDIVTYEGKVISPDLDVLYILNKPKGYICSNLDKHNKKNVFDLIDSNLRLFTVGRLDRDTTGILLITNNGDLSYQLTHPKHGVEKKYYVTSFKDIDNKNIPKLKKGIRLDDGVFVKADLKRLYKEDGKIFWDISLTEGKNREIKRIFTHFESKVISLHRYKFADIELKSLKIGGYRKLNKREFDRIQKI
ncbi:MAG: pseudouridine synthase [Candidatus Marinimicrobia bacterium]|nr:pseudouridine synthase [Candidatus Neomarinimicrobiota bacterium]|tara:strand:- start:112 stop:810 length:699 start_codon:yes stop_codon:yes gene_type:complete